jgi:hypothetical protein
MSVVGTPVCSRIVYSVSTVKKKGAALSVVLGMGKNINRQKKAEFGVRSNSGRRFLLFFHLFSQNDEK